MTEIEFEPRGGRKRKYCLDVPIIMLLSSVTEAVVIAKIYGVPINVITKIFDGRYVLEGDEFDPERIKALGLKICECCGKRIVPPIPIKIDRCYVHLRKMCSFCYRYADAGVAQDCKCNVSRNEMPS